MENLKCLFMINLTLFLFMAVQILHEVRIKRDSKREASCLVRVVSLGHQVACSKQSLRICGGKACLGLPPSPDPTHVGDSGPGSAPFRCDVSLGH